MLSDDDLEPGTAPPDSLMAALIMAQGMYPEVRLFEPAIPADLPPGEASWPASAFALGA